MKTKRKNQVNKNIFWNKTEMNYHKNKKKRCVFFKELLRFYVELQNRLKALEENLSIKNSENNRNFLKRNIPQTTEKEL